MTTQETSTVFLDSLPAEDVLFNHIFPRLEAVDWISLLSTNKAMYNITNAFLSVNKTLSIDPLSPISPATFTILTENATNLRTLTLSKCSWMTDQLLRPVLRNNKKLNCIDLSCCDGCTEGILQILTVQCPHISRLILRECNWVVPEALDYMVYYRNNLKKQNPNTGDILQAMGKGLRTNLKARTKSKYHGKDHLYHNLQLKELKPKIQTNISKMHPHMLEVDFTGCGLINDTNVDNFVKVFKHLQIFKIGNNPNISDLSMKSIATNLKSLHTLDISSCYKITKSGLYTVAKYCTKLKSVEIGKSQFPGFLLSFMHDKKISVKKGNFSTESETRSNPTALHAMSAAGPSNADTFDGVIFGFQEIIK